MASDRPDHDKMIPERLVQSEGCLTVVAPFPKPVTSTENPLDIGSPSFRFVDVDKNVVPISGKTRAEIALVGFTTKGGSP